MKTKISAKTELNSNDVSLFGKRVLKIAKQEGKGWFAIMLGQHISHKTVMPKYILDSLIFSKDNYTNELIADIIEYRINKNFSENDKLDFTSCNKAIDDFRKGVSKLSLLKTELQKVIKNDQIINFLNRF